MTSRPHAVLAALIASGASALAACHTAAPARATTRVTPTRATPTRVTPTRVTPVAGFCGRPSAVALSRARALRTAPRAAATSPGALIVRIAPADSGLTVPEGPVRVFRPAAGAAGEARALAPAGRGWARSGPLPAGRYVVEAAGTGYQPSRLTVAVRPGATDTVRFRLAAACVRRR